ncbi:MAG: saccharopine dehydrogenase NADP-binding domain-containing protein [Alphaproteobacteria bacterium]|nr:saccharopine dehydrogenase NADP-binding domain-containing protein [Alphaproteobacteria bacterium]
MTTRILIIGGYGNFGRFIAKHLARESTITLIISGRSLNKAKAFAATLKAANPPESAALDIDKNLPEKLGQIKPDIVIHTSGPFQSQGYHVAKSCITWGCHYIDLADGRDFVANIGELDAAAKEKNVLICSGASSVPCLTSALVDHYKKEFKTLEKIEYAITTAQRTNRGLATTYAVLSYAGKPFTTLIDGKMQEIYGWHDMKARKFYGLNKRLLGNCDIPDLEIFPKAYPDLKTIRFRAGLELKILHRGLWLLSWLVRLKILRSLQSSAPILLKLSLLLDPLGSDDSGFYMMLSGKDESGKDKDLTFDLVAHHGDGLNIPSMPAILMAKKIASDQITETGAYPCTGFITLEEYLKALSEFDIKWKTS